MTKTEKIKPAMRTPLPYYGGKTRMLKYILPLIPPHKLYIEPFFGGGAVFFAKEPSDTEVINDMNNNVIAFYRALKSQPEKLRRLVHGTLHSREEYRRAYKIFFSADKYSDLDRAWATWVCCVQGFANKAGSWGFGRSNSKEKNTHNRRLAFTNDYTKRMELAQIESIDALKVIAKRDGKDSFFYVDPPYVNSNQGHYEGYTQEQFEQLLGALSKVKGKFLLSSYPNSALDRYAKKCGWHQRRIRQKISANSASEKFKTEVLTWNFNESSFSLNGLNGATHPVFLLARIIELLFTHNS